MKLRQDNDWSDVDQAAVPFVARQLRRAEVVWINLKWYSDIGVEVGDSVVLTDLKTQILRDYAFIVPRPEDADESFTDQRKTFYADRYGEHGVVAHGGSGRAGSWGGMQVKGIGLTPLVGTAANWLHAHGCVWMEEAIREVIYSELFDAEYPYGVVPIVAVIDTLLHAEMPKGHLGERRALLLRPVVLRPAHLLRAVFYRSSLDVLGEQRRDVTRTEGWVKWYQKLGDARQGEGVALPLEDLNRRAAETISFGEIFRLSSGGISSSSISLEGKLIDFGGARAMLDWRQAEMLSGLPGFGRDSQVWVAILATLFHSCEKSGLTFDREKQLELFFRSYEEATVKNILSFWGFGLSELFATEANQLVRITSSIFRSQQRRPASYVTDDPSGSEWIYDDLLRLCRGLDPKGSYRAHLLEARDLIAAIGARQCRSLPSMKSLLYPALRHSFPRQMIFRESLQRALFESVIPINRDQRLRENAIDDVLATCLSASRRVFPAHMSNRIDAQYCDSFCNVLDINGPDDSSLFIEARRLGKSVKLGGLIFPLEELTVYGGVLGLSTWRARLSRQALRSGSLHLSRLDNRIEVPLWEGYDL